MKQTRKPDEPAVPGGAAGVASAGQPAGRTGSRADGVAEPSESAGPGADGVAARSESTWSGADGVVRPDAGTDGLAGPSTDGDSVAELRGRLREFAARRGWQPFHTPKNLAMAVAGEAGELVAEFQWLTGQESVRLPDDPDALAAVRGELADVLLYLVQLADALDVDLLAAAREKMAINEHRFPVDHGG